MANLIDTSFFIGDIEVPNISQEEIATDLTNSINLYEKEVLIALLGYPMYVELRAAVPVAGDKWYKLINGDDFTIDGVTYRWDGLLGENKKSLIAYYVYFMHRKKRVSYNAGVGQEVEPATDNSQPVSLYNKLVWVWNEFIKMHGGYDELDYYYYYYPSYDLPSAYNYLVANKANFTNWNFKGSGGKINIFGI